MEAGKIVENPFATIYRTCNTGNNIEKYKLIRDGILSVPRYLDVELTNCCNFSCRFCPTGTKSVNRTKGYMPDVVVDALAENIKKFNIPGVRFSRWGEPTMHPKYLEIMKIIKDTGCLVHFNTNGSFLNKESMLELLRIHVDSIKFSFQGADEATYNEMRYGGSYCRLLENLRMMWEIRGDNPVPFIQVSTTLTSETEAQKEEFKRDIENYCDYYNIGYTNLTHLAVDKMDVDETEKEKIRALQKKERIQHVYQAVCNEAFDKLSINWNGDVTLCCGDYDNFMLVGNLLDMDLREIFNSRSADAYRQIILNKQYSKIKCCSTCYETVPLIK